MSVTLRLHEDDAQAIAKGLDALAHILEVDQEQAEFGIGMTCGEAIQDTWATMHTADHPYKIDVIALLRRLSAAFATAVKATVRET